MSKQTKACCFVVPYFGKLPNYFSAFLKSCETNGDFDWIIITDDTYKYNYPNNVKVIYMSFDDMKQKVQLKFSFKVNLDNPKKLCDFKPAYGYIFEEELIQYRYWGYCDLDQFFGNLKKFIPIQFLEKFDKLFALGHMTIYKNTYEINRLFMKPLKVEVNGINNVKDIFTNSNNFAFDEWTENININLIAEQENLNIFYGNEMVDVKPYKSIFLNSIFDGNKKEWTIDYQANFILLYKNGDLFKIDKINNCIEYKEVMYVHLQKRKLDSKCFDSDKKNFIIYPNKIISFNDNEIDEKKLKKILFFLKFKSHFKIEESKKRIKFIKELWVHRFNKYILKRK